MDTKYIDLFSQVETTLDKQKKQKLRGLNDFNILTTVLNYHDEVRLHSRMIGSLLNPCAKHYQGTLFLEIFLEKLNLAKWGLDLSNTTVHIEYHDIDLYITDGSKHLIVENKIWAGDQPCQIMKYINIIVEESNDSLLEENKKIYKDKTGNESKILNENLLRVVYLTPIEKDVPTEHKEDDGYIFFSGENTRLDDCSKQPNTKLLVPYGLKRYSARYHKIAYKDEIISWLNASKAEVRNISNLSESIEQYINVVKMVNGNYKGNVVTIKEELLKKDDNDNFMNKNELMTALELDKEMKEIKGKILLDFFVSVKDEILSTDKEYKDITNQIIPNKRQYDEVKCKNFFSEKSNFFGVFVDCKFGNNLYLYISILWGGLYYGIVKCNNEKLVKMQENTSLNSLLPHTVWNEMTWHSNTHDKFDMTDLSNDKVWNLFTDFKNSDEKQKILKIITKARNLIKTR